MSPLILILADYERTTGEKPEKIFCSVELFEHIPGVKVIPRADFGEDSVFIPLPRKEVIQSISLAIAKFERKYGKMAKYVTIPDILYPGPFVDKVKIIPSQEEELSVYG